MLKRWGLLSALLILVGIAAGCARPATPTVAPTPSPLPPTETPRPTATATPQPLPTPTVVRIWLDPAVPSALQQRLLDVAQEEALTLTDEASSADIRIGRESAPLVGRWIYVAVAPFPTLVDDIAWADLRRFWAGEPAALSALSAAGADAAAEPPVLFLTSATLQTLQLLLGPPAENALIEVTAPEDVVLRTWEQRERSWAIVPFDQLEPRWKVLKIDGANVLDKGLDVETYPLKVDLQVSGPGADRLAARIAADGHVFTNRDLDRMTVLMMTGVTALVRATAFEMEQRGILYPAEKIGPLLRSADITHISNEIPFARNCPPPDRNQQSLVFCSDPKYMELLRAVGADIIELTGNHFQDYGSAATLDTLAMYDREGWPYYGGGKDLQDARKAIIVEDHGNRLSFIGCNPVGPDFAWATEDEPGAAPCDYAYMHETIGRLRQEVDVPIVTWQYWEHYMYEATPDQKDDFRAMVNAGALIVSGSQAHHPQAIEFYGDGFIHYGLGNLFFDQMWSVGTRQEIVDRHVIYEGRHISTELMTFMLEDYCQPRPMTETERRELLVALFQASGW